MKKIFLIIEFFIGFWLIACTPTQNNKVTIAAAANMQFALVEITNAFTVESGIETETILGSSAKLNAQIKEGAPFQVFVSADMNFPQDLFESGFTVAKPRIYANGTLVLWSFKNEVLPSFELIETDQVKHFAIPNPKTAPYGIAAMQVLNSNGYYSKIHNKLVYGESVGQTNQFIITGAAQIGLTSKSVVMSSEMRNKGNWIEISENLHEPISQGIVLIKRKQEVSKDAQEFYEFLFSDTAQSILEKYGYRLP